MGGEGDEEIYQTPIIDSQSAAVATALTALTPQPLALKRTDISGNLVDKRGMYLSRQRPRGRGFILLPALPFLKGTLP